MLGELNVDDGHRQLYVAVVARAVDGDVSAGAAALAGLEYP